MTTKWAIPKSTKSAVKRAGDRLKRAEECNERQVDESMDVLSNWRASHAYPMHAMLMSLRKNSDKIDKSAVVVQRLKRTPSILAKLQRFPNMSLQQMQDIGGCRSVVGTVQKAERLSNTIIRSRTLHRLHKQDNYIETPKESGYRGIHLVYRYRGKKPEYQEMFIELQIRSRVQHAWATAVEIVDTFTRQGLKVNQGQEEWKTYFQYASAEFAKLENRPVASQLEGVDTITELSAAEKRVDAIRNLTNFTISANILERHSKSKSDYFLLELEDSIGNIKVSHFAQSALETATARYLKLEKDSRQDGRRNVVLVSASSVKELRLAYPNYFADSKTYLALLRRVYEKPKDGKKG